MIWKVSLASLKECLEVFTLTFVEVVDQVTGRRLRLCEEAHQQNGYQSGRNQKLGGIYHCGFLLLGTLGNLQYCVVSSRKYANYSAV